MITLLKAVTTRIRISGVANWGAFIGLLGVLFILSLSSSQLVGQYQFYPVPWKDSHSCEWTTGTATTDGTPFRAYVTTDRGGYTLCTHLSSLSAFTNSYSQVSATWALPAEVISRLLVERHFDLLQVRPELLDATTSLSGDLYRPVGKYREYHAYLISRSVVPELTPEYLESNVIGLVSDPASRSGYRLPMKAFREAGARLRHLHLKRYASHSELRSALERGDVDAIGSYWSDIDRSSFPHWEALQLGTIDQGMTWYLASEIYGDIPLRCAIVQSLEFLADRAAYGYFSDLVIAAEARRDCD